MDSTLAPSDGIEMASVTTDTRCDESTSAQAPTGCDTVPVTIEYDGQDDKLTFSMKRLMKFAGPGLLMSIAYVDPGNLESDLQTGARTGYTLGWLVFWSTFLGFLVQLLAMRLGIVTNKHLAQHCRDVYPVAPRIFLWLMTEVAIIGSDIQEVIGSAIAIQLLSNSAVPLWAGVLITGVDTFFLLFLEKLGARKLEAFFGVLVATMTASFGVMYVKAKCPTADVLLGVLLPKMRSSDLDIAMGVVGALVMPHNIFLHSALVQSRKIDMSSKVAKREAILYNAIESGASLGITVVINLFVVAVFAAGFHGTDAVKDVGLSSAGTYLGARFGEVTKIIWAIGLLAAGQSSTMTGTYTGQFVMSGFMDLQVSPWARAMITRSIALLPTLAFAIAYAGSSKMDVINQGLNVLQSFQLPFALVPVLYMNTRQDLMGDFILKSYFKWVVQAISALLMLLNMCTVIIASWHGLSQSAVTGVPTVAAIGLYCMFVLYLLVGPCQIQAALERVDNVVAWRSVGWLARGGPTPGIGDAEGYTRPCEAASLITADAAGDAEISPRRGHTDNGAVNGHFVIDSQRLLDEA